MGFSYLNVFNSLFFDIESHKDIKRTLEQASDVLDSLITKFGEIQNELTLGISGNDDFVDTVVILFIRKIMEQLDAINVLYSTSLFSPAEVLLRSLLENIIGLQFILKEDTERRAAAYYLEHHYEELKKADRYFNEQSKSGKAMLDDIGSERFQLYHEACEKKRAALGRIIESNEIFKGIDIARKKKIQSKKNKRAKHPHVQWYEVCSNVTTFRGMMIETGYGKYYDGIYGGLSLETHGLNATMAMHPDEDGFLLKWIRDPSGGGTTLSLACTFSVGTLVKLYRYLGDGKDERAEFRDFFTSFTVKRNQAIYDLDDIHAYSPRRKDE